MAAARVSTKVPYYVAAGVRHLAGDSMDPVEEIEQALGLTGPGVGRRAHAKDVLIEHLEGVEPDWSAGDVAGEALEAGAVLGRCDLLGMDGEARVRPRMRPVVTGSESA